jgi:Hsp70 protein
VTAPQQPGFLLGVDLGTSNTVAVVRGPDGRTRPLLFDGQPIMPSAVFLDQDGRLHVGRDAQRMAQLDPARCEPNPKRRIDERTILLGDRQVPVTQVLAALLRAIAEKAVETVGYLPPAVITHPAAWGAPRRGVLAEAVRQAGWPPVRLVPEPVAAARYFAQVLRRPVPVGSSVAVFDFGGGTLDVAVVRHEQDGTYAVTSSGGDESLGGLDLDAALVAHVGTLVGQRYPQIWQHLSAPQSTADRRYRRLFWEDVRGAKEMLSRTTAAPVPVPGVDQAVHLTREELEARTGPLLDRAVRAAETAIGQTGLRPEMLSGLFLVGGSSRVPAVARLLHARLGIAPTVLEQPELPVAEGSLAELAPVPDATAPMTVHAASAAPYPMSGAPASPMPVSAQPGQASPVSPMPTSPPGPFPPYGPPPARPWYKRKGILIPSGAAVLALLIVAGIVLFHNPYPERPFTPLSQVGTVKFVYDSPDTGEVIDGDTAILISTSCSGSCYTSNKITVQGVSLSAPKRKPWTRHYTSPNGGDWSTEPIVGAGVIVLPYADTTDDSYNTVKGGVTVLDQDGHKLWSQRYGYDADYDWWGVMDSPNLLMHYDSGASTLTAYDPRHHKVRWTVKNVTGAPWFDDSYDNYSGPAAFTYYQNSQRADPNSSRLVLFNGGTARVWDASNGKQVGGQRSVGSDSARLVYDGVLYVAGTGAGYSLSAYSLDDIGKATWSTSAPSGWKTSYLAPCGKSLICATESKAGTDTTSQIRAFDADSGDRKWKHTAPDAHGAVPVGDRVLVSYHDKSDRLDTDVLDASDGSVLHTWGGEAARLDDATALVSSGDVYGLGGSDVPDASGFALSGSGVQSFKQDTLGPVDEDLNQCTWNDTYLVCADDSTNYQFVIYKFRH